MDEQSLDLNDKNMNLEEENHNELDGDFGIYEVGFQIIPTITEEEASGTFASIKNIITQKGGKVISEGAPELVNLQYEMRKKLAGKYEKFMKGYFGWVKFEIAKQDIKNIKESIEAIQEVLRLIVISTVRENTLISQKPHAILKKPVIEVATLGVTTPEALDEEIDKTLENLEIK